MHVSIIFFTSLLLSTSIAGGPLSEAQSMNGVIRSRYVTQCRVDLVVESETNSISSLPSNGRRDRTDTHA